ncbi:MAG: pyridoxal 5'-phosphate synthase glutaminase subunit PdxT [Planctomycetota bacterium]
MSAADSNLTIGVLALQGSFDLHVRSLERSGASTRLVRRPEDLNGLHGLVIPGGESTTMSLLAERYGLFGELRRRGREGLAMFGTCAGAILLGRDVGDPPRLGLVDIDVDRNAYGRQVDSFTASVAISVATDDATPFSATFIRAPKISREAVDHPSTELLAAHEGNPVLIRWENYLLGTFHPELTDDLRVHRYFLEMCRSTVTNAQL